MPNNNKRFIGESFSVKEVSVESAREKNIHHEHLSTLHIWWARRPLASSRATKYAALIQASKDSDEWNKKRKYIINHGKTFELRQVSIIEHSNQSQKKRHKKLKIIQCIL